MDQRLRAFVSRTSILLFLEKKRRARTGSRSPHTTVCPWRTSNCASRDPVPPAPRTKMRIGPQLYHILAPARRGPPVPAALGADVFDLTRACQTFHKLVERRISF